MTGTIDNALRKSGIYTVPTFKATLHIAGSISDELLMEARNAEPGVNKKIGNMSLFMAVSDPTGIRALTGIRVDGMLVPVNAATEAGLQGVSAELTSAASEGMPRRREFAVLLAAYFSGVLKSRAAGVVTGALAGVCYSLLYLLVLSVPHR